ncbi:NAD(P)-binding protein [Mycena venus]|uniref:NAD(P)-binding protein n=1 Tax=Mycena venus TaxID=2733690 RepID=A0A8H6XY49_9AGAR|nr:NAD(P)-binding protein [Mycena venus]
MSLTPGIWLITGASSGFGRTLAEVVLAQGEIAVATLRYPADLEDLAVTNPDRLLVLKCDVTKLDEVLSAFSAAIERFGRVDVVFNNAGYAIVSEIEATPEDAARALFDVNFLGYRQSHTGAVFFPAPDAYRGEGLPSQVVREWFQDGSGIRGDPRLGAEAIYRFSKLESPPMRWAMGKDSIGGVRMQIKQVTAETDQFESWSDNLEVIV